MTLSLINYFPICGINKEIKPGNTQEIKSVYISFVANMLQDKHGQQQPELWTIS